MSPRTRRIVIPLLVGAAAIAVVVVVFSSGGGKPIPATPDTTPETSEVAAAITPAATGDASAGDAAGPAASPDAAAEAAVPPPPEIEGLRATAPPVDASDDAWGPIGTFDPREGRLHLTFSSTGAGMETITIADKWITARDAREARAHFAALDAGSTSPPPLPADDRRYVLSSPLPLQPGVDIPALAAQGISINDGEIVHLLWDVDENGNRVPVWSAVAPGVFQSVIVDGEDRPVLRITREFEVGTRHDITLCQKLDNLTDAPMTVRWYQYGPSDLTQDRTRYIDRRRFRFGHLLPQDPSRMIVDADKRMVVERMDLWKDKYETESIWPNDTSLDRGYELSWFAATNRYFTLTVHPVLDPLDTASRSLADVVEKISTKTVGPKTGDESHVFTRLYSPRLHIPAGGSASLDMGVYAGPMDPRILNNEEPYRSLGMRLLVLYQMSSFACCTACTFQWLAHGLITFLSLCHSVIGDWGLAIIFLVCVVRLLLHPLTKRAQINMQGFSKKMGSLKPEMDRLQKKYPDEPKRMQSEQLRLMREHGINPMQFLGCLPMFLQTPIWIALYAMLYFAFQIRQEPAFYGIFQKITGGAWPFLGDLSSPDSFIPLFAEPRMFTFLFFAFDYSSINVLPVLMGALFYLQQKYMTPPPNPSMSKDQIKQQKIMRVLMVVMMPVVLYAAPSGLTLYILTSSSIAILEGRYVRKHIDELAAAEENGEDTTGPERKKVVKKKKKGRDALGRAYAAAMERAEQKRRAKREPNRSFKQKKKRK